KVTLSPRRATMASAGSTPGRSSATMIRSRGAISSGIVTSHHALGDVDQLPDKGLQRLAIGRILQSVHIVIGLMRKGQSKLARDHMGLQRGEDQPQRSQRPRAAEAALRGGRDCKGALAKPLPARLMRILHPAHPIE